MSPRRLKAPARYYHAGARGLDVGDWILPADETGAVGLHHRLSNFSRRYVDLQAVAYRPDRIYVDSDWRSAGAWGGVLPGCRRRSHNRPGGCDCEPDLFSPFAGDVYEVEVDGPVEPDESGWREPFPQIGRARRAQIVDVVGRGVERRWISRPVRPGAPWFHGGIPNLEVGDLILPPSQTGAAGKNYIAEKTTVYDPSDRVFAAQYRPTSYIYAVQHPHGDEEFGGGLYVVEPVGGEWEPDPYHFHIDGVSACAPAARVVRVFRAEVPRKPLRHQSPGWKRHWLAKANEIRSREGLPPLDRTVIREPDRFG